MSKKKNAVTDTHPVQHQVVPNGEYDVRVLHAEVRNHRDKVHKAVCTALEILNEPFTYEQLWKWNNLTSAESVIMFRGEFRNAGIIVKDESQLEEACEQLIRKRLRVRVKYGEGPYPKISIIGLSTFPVLDDPENIWS